MSEKDAKTKMREFGRVAKALAMSRRGNLELAEDFSQYALMRKYVDGHLSTLEQMYVDFLRKEFGDTTRRSQSCTRIRSQKGLAKSTGVLHNSSADVSEFVGVEDHHEIVQTNIARHVDLREHLIISLLNDGHTQEAVGSYIGVTGSRISQIMTEVGERLAGIEELEHYRDAYDLDAEKSKLYVNWI